MNNMKKSFLNYITIEPYQVIPLRARVDLGVMAQKG